MTKALAVAGAVLLLCSIAPHAPALNAPRLILWAWERPEDLRFLNPARAGVAFLAATMAVLPNGEIRLKPRLQPLLLPRGISVLRVIRIETPAKYSLPDADALAMPLAAIANRPGAQGIQIDFDARASERRFYGDILAGLRKKTSAWIGITALASWCDGDRWLNEEPISEATPMLFRMERDEFRDMPAASACRSSTGLSTDEAWPMRARPGRIYVFNPHSWTQVEYNMVATRIGEWR